MLIINGIEFKSNAAASEHIRRMFNRIKLHTPLGESDHAFVSDLLLRHPEAEAKIGVGIKHFTVAPDSVYKRNRHFIVHRVDGTFVDFSWMKCVRGQARTPRATVMHHLREAVREQTAGFKRQFFASKQTKLFCPISGLPINYKNSDVDHDPILFVDLADSFMLAESKTYEGTEIKKQSQNGVSYFSDFVDQDFKKRWQDFHKQHAQLRVISRLENMKKDRNRQLIIHEQKTLF